MNPPLTNNYFSAARRGVVLKTLTVRFRRVYYVGSANGDVWKSRVVARDMSAPITLASDEAASTDISQGGFDGVRGEVINQRPCGGDAPSTLLLIKTSKDLKIEDLATEIYDSCGFNGGSYVKGRPRVTTNAVTIEFKEREKRYTLKFDGNDPDKDLQVSERR